MKTLTLNFSTGYLNKLSHIKIGGESNYVFMAKNVSDLSRIYAYSYEKSVQIIPVGGGSNILFGDTGNYIILPDRYMKKYLHIEGESIAVSSNFNINELIIKLAKVGLGGLEFLAGIPAHIGGIVLMNAGAYGDDISNYVSYVKIVDSIGRKRVLKREDINFGYRKSGIEGFIYEVALKLQKMDAKEILETVKANIAKRKKIQPLEYPNLGSIFKNPKGDYAGRLIEKAGLKGKTIGNAKISEKHANFFINTGNANFKDMINLINLAKKTVKDKFKIDLKPEIRIVQW